MKVLKKHIHKLLPVIYKCVNLLEYVIYIEYSHLKDNILESHSSIDEETICVKQIILILRLKALERLDYE